MKQATIISKILTTLQESADLNYIDDNNMFLGVRENITIFPCLLIEKIDDSLLDESYPYEGRILSVNITGYIKVHDKDKQIVGDTNTKGVVDIENDIMKALSSDNTLGLEDVYDVRILKSVEDYEFYPVRGFALNVEVHYRQNRTTRT